MTNPLLPGFTPYQHNFAHSAKSCIDLVMQNGWSGEIGILVAPDVFENLGKPDHFEVWGCRVYLSQFLPTGRIFAVRGVDVEQALKGPKW